MFRTGARAVLRSQTSSSLAPARTASKRFLTTDPPHLKSRSWKNSALRWGLAAAGIYYYNTSSVFAEHPQNNLLIPNVDTIDEEKDHPTIDRLLESSKNKAQKEASVLQSAVETASDKALEQTAAVHGGPLPGQDGQEATPATSGAADLEAEAEGEGAFNPVTGEINWDCPCLGGMAYGPCGEEFRAAFSCFVYSTEEPKGMDCIEKFGAMQECFRAHPEHYKGELEDDEALDEGLAAEKEELNREIEERKQQVAAAQSQRRLLEEPEPVGTAPEQKPQASKKSKKTSTRNEKKTTNDSPSELSPDKEAEHGSPSSDIRQPKPPAVSSEAVPESEQLVPKAAHDATDVTSEHSQSHAN